MSEPTPITDAILNATVEHDDITFVHLADKCKWFERILAAQRTAREKDIQEAAYLATLLWERCYKADSPDWKPLDYLSGILSQISNMTSGLGRIAVQRTALLALFDEAERNGHQGIAIRGREILG